MLLINHIRVLANKIQNIYEQNNLLINIKKEIYKYFLCTIFRFLIFKTKNTFSELTIFFLY